MTSAPQTKCARRACSRQRYLRAKCRDHKQNSNLDGKKNIPAETNPALEQLDQKELADLLTTLGNKLKPETRAVLEDFFLNQLSYKELAKKHQIPMGTVATRIHRGLSGCREILGKNPKLMEEIEAFLR
jgi:RNA polymerase sigma factor (sigma-70 family)